MRVTRASVQVGISIALSLALLAYLATFIEFSKIPAAFSKIPPSVLLLTTLLLITSTLLGGVRLFLILSDVGARISILLAARAMFLGSIGGLAFFQLIGQTITRVAILRKVGVPVAITLIASIYERVVSTLLVSIAAGLGVVFLFGKLTFSEAATFFSLSVFLVSAGLAVSFGVVFAYPSVARALLRPLASGRVALGVLRIVTITMAMQAPTLVAYVLLGQAIAPSVPLSNIVASSLIVMFAAALPISFGGWGVRELGAVYAYGAIGIEVHEAVVVSIVLGILSQIVLLAATSLSLLLRSGDASADGAGLCSVSLPEQVKDWSLWFWGVGLAIATLILFQIKVPIGASAVLLNIADPIALVGAVFFLFAWSKLKFRQAVWRLGAIEIIILAMTIVIILGFLIGWWRIGLTNWALFNRLIGWAILLCYALSGALIVVFGGTRGLRVLARTYLAAIVGVVIVDLGVRLWGSISPGFGANTIMQRMEGFAGNPNAFSFQLLVAIAIAIMLAMSRGQQQRRVDMVLAMAVGVCLAGLWFASSRSGFIAFAVMLVAAFALRSIRIRDLAVWVASGLTVVVFAEFIFPSLSEYLLSAVGPNNAGGSIFFTRSIFEDSNDGLRLQSLARGLDLWLKSPIFGAGIGAFLFQWTAEFGKPLVIHNSALWVLAELGLVGAVVFATGFFLIAKTAWQGRSDPLQGRQYVLLLLLSAMMIAHATFHDMLFQRTFWLFFGASLAVPAALVRYNVARRDQKPSILYVIGSLRRGGAETHVAGIARGLKAQSFDPTIYCTAEAGPLVPEMRAAGVEVVAPHVPWAVLRRWRVVRGCALVYSAVRLVFFIRSRDPTIVHFFLPEAYIIGGIAVSLSRSPRRVMSRRSLNYYQSRWPLLAVLERHLHPAMDLVLGNSMRVVRQLHDEEGAPLERLGLIYNGVDSERFAPDIVDNSYRERLGIARDALTITIVANLIRYKGHRDLLAGLAGVAAKMPEKWALAIVGRDDGEGEALKKLVAQAGLQDHVVFLGEREDTAQILAVSDIGVNASHEEGFSNAVLEGMAAALPMVVTDVGGNPEAVLEGQTGFVVPPRLPAELGQAIARLAADKGLRQKMGRLGRERVLVNFSVSVCLDHYAMLYRDLAANLPQTEWISTLQSPDPFWNRTKNPVTG